MIGRRGQRNGPEAAFRLTQSMPPPALFQFHDLDLSRILIPPSEIYSQFLPHRHEFALLSGICHFDPVASRIVSVVEVSPQDWWVRGHIPGRPLLPGVLILEMAAQTVSVGSTLLDRHRSASQKPFVGFGGIESCKFREAVCPPARLHILGVEEENRPRRIVSRTQGYVGSNLVFEATITGLVMATANA